MRKWIAHIELVSYDVALRFMEDELSDSFCYAMETMLNSPSNKWNLFEFGQSKTYPNLQLQFELDYIAWNGNSFSIWGYVIVTEKPSSTLSGHKEYTMFSLISDTLDEVDFLDLVNTKCRESKIRVAVGGEDNSIEVKNRQELDVLLFGHASEHSIENKFHSALVPLQWKYYDIIDVDVE